MRGSAELCIQAAARPVYGHPTRRRVENVSMTVEEVDAYLAGLKTDQRAALEALRVSILKVIPDAEQGISYGMPAFRIDGKVVAGFAAFTSHLAFLPHSGQVLSHLGPAVAGYKHTAGSLHFSVGKPLPDELVRQLVQEKLKILGR